MGPIESSAERTSLRKELIKKTKNGLATATIGQSFFARLTLLEPFLQAPLAQGFRE